MIFFLRLPLVFLICLLTTASLAAQPADISECEAYLKKQRDLGCTQKNYLVRFGYKYCRSFIEQQSRFTEQGQQVTARIRACLIEEIEKNEKMVCQNALILSVNAHVGCYVTSGFCDLGMYDRWIIFENIWPELLNKRMRDTSLEILRQCFAI